MWCRAPTPPLCASRQTIAVTPNVCSAQSNHVRSARLNILAEREAQLGVLKEDAKKRLGRLAQSDKYSSLLESLIVEVRLKRGAHVPHGVSAWGEMGPH